MSDTYAFPVPNDAAVNGDAGMTLRDYFAGQALSGMLANPEPLDLLHNEIADYAYEVADAMLEARKND